MTTTRGTLCSAPIFDSYNKDNDGEGLVPTPSVFNSYNEDDNEEGAKYCVSPLFLAPAIKMKRRRKGVSIAIPPSLVFTKQRYEGSDNIIKKFLKCSLV
jgi:hypothetical protein